MTKTEKAIQLYPQAQGPAQAEFQSFVQLVRFLKILSILSPLKMNSVDVAMQEIKRKAYVILVSKVNSD